MFDITKTIIGGIASFVMMKLKEKVLRLFTKIKPFEPQTIFLLIKRMPIKTIMQSLCVSLARTINPDLSYEYTKWLAQGDDHCEKVLELKNKQEG